MFFAGLVSAFHVLNMWLVLSTSTIRGIHVCCIMLLAYFKDGLDRNPKKSRIHDPESGCRNLCLRLLYYHVRGSYKRGFRCAEDSRAVMILVLLDLTYRFVGRGMAL
jgi:hypothetical protein